ncbi:MAG: hypothetical protein OXL40_07100 [Bacteroidota bacterium]|nr:hypothetical protein [Bacteroidota bacterium]
MKPDSAAWALPPYQQLVIASCLPVLVMILANTTYAQENDEVSCVQPESSWCELSDEQAEFLHQSRQATLPYLSLTAAVADGFRPVGADAPAMGRHWVNFARLFDGEINAAKPEILMYADVDGRDSLVGIGFGYAVGRETQASFPANPFPPDAWHRHSGSLDMESHRTDHEDGGPHDPRLTIHSHEAEAAVSVLHSWVWIDNPAGVLEPNNWALPYVRLGLSRPENTSPEADRALSLSSIGAEFFIARAELFPELGPAPSGGWAEALRRAEAEIKTWWHARPEGPLASSEVEWLGRLWKRSGLKGL